MIVHQVRNRQIKDDEDRHHSILQKLSTLLVCTWNTRSYRVCVIHCLSCLNDTSSR